MYLQHTLLLGPRLTGIPAVPSPKPAHGLPYLVRAHNTEQPEHCLRHALAALDRGYALFSNFLEGVF